MVTLQSLVSGFDTAREARTTVEPNLPCIYPAGFTTQAEVHVARPTLMAARKLASLQLALMHIPVTAVQTDLPTTEILLHLFYSYLER